jgi:mono/diheme cytochrome c family protein
MKTKFNWIMLLLGSVVFVTAAYAEKSMDEKISGKQVFDQHCASCHIGGGNLVKPKYSIAGSKTLATLATFKSYLSAPPGHMPYYQTIVGNQKTLESLYKYCKQLKKRPMRLSRVNEGVQ